QPRISLVGGRIAAVGVDAVPVERQRRIAEEKHVVGDDRAVPGAACSGLDGPVPDSPARRLAIDEILLLLDGDTTLPRHRPADGDEYQRSRAPALLFDATDHGALLAL